MDWQQLVSLVIVGSTAAFFLWSRHRRGRLDFGRSTACGGCAAGQELPQYSVVFRARKGQRPQVTIKMK